jgi:glutamate dehydrogenase
MMEASGSSAPQVARAYSVTREAFDLRELWSGIEALDNRVSAALQLQMLLDVARLTEAATTWFLQAFPDRLDVSATTSTYRGPLRELAGVLEDLLPSLPRRELRKRARELARQGVPEPLARRVAAARYLAAGTDVVRLALEAGTTVERVARVYWAIGERFCLDWLRVAAAEVKIETPWQRAALDLTLSELARQQSALARQALAEAGAGEDWKATVEGWAARRASEAARADKLVEELRAAGTLDVAMLTLAGHQMARLAAAEPSGPTAAQSA